jgi:hypothetical protein
MNSPLDILARTFRAIDLPDGAPQTCATCGTALVGVYLLVENDEIVYIGSSIDIARRLYGHGLHVQTRPFDRALWLPLPARMLRHYEGALIRALRPRYNGRAPASHGYDAEILWGLGLKAELSEEEIATEPPPTGRPCERRPYLVLQRAPHGRPLRIRSLG